MPGVERIFVPGERSHETRTIRTSRGIPIPPALLRGLDQLATELDIAKLR
jgi:L-2-hydroxycarboxylate dehydrogenase (NAD+)